MHLFSLLLRLYPSSFRNEYGDEMRRLFAERRRRAGTAGRVALWIEAVRDAFTTAPRVHLDILAQDLRYTRRALARTPSFAAAAILVMALGIGATTAVFSVTDRVLLRPLPFQNPQTLVRVWEKVPGYAQLEPSPLNYRDWTERSRSFGQLEAYMDLPMNMVRAEPMRVAGVALTGPLLPMLGVQPFLGRLFTTEESTLDGPNAVVISHRLWLRAFGGDRAVIGQPVRLDDATYTIVGVMARDFYFPNRTTDLWVPLTLGPSWFADGDNNFLGVLGRLKDHVTLEGARAEMDGVMVGLEKLRPKENGQTRATLRLFGDQVSWQSRLLIRILTGASVCLLLIACTNLASLLLTRFAARRRELIVRSALGAGRERLTRQLLTESLVLSLAGGAAGVAFAYFATPLLARLVPTTLPVADATVLDPRVLLVAAGVTILTGIAFGVLPAWRISRSAQAVSLREGARGAVGGRERLRAVLVTAQIAASIVLLVSTGLLVRALVRVQATDPGFKAEGVLTLRTALPIERYKSTVSRSQFYERVVSDVQALPGVTAAAYTSFTPMVMRGGIWAVEMPGIDPQRDAADVHTASLRFLTPGYFSALGVPLLAGRDVSSSDTFEAPFVAVVSESFAQRYWPKGDAIGRTFTIAFHERTIVGIAGDVRVRGLEQVSEPQVYVPHKQLRDGWLPFYAPKDLLVRTSGDPLALASAIRQIVRAVDPELPVADLQTMEDVVHLQTAPRRTQTAVLGLFAGMAMLLAAIGVHGLLSFGVSQRRQEIGVRMALGATRGRVLRLVLNESALLALIGGAVGLGVAYAAARGFDTLLAGVQPNDPGTYGGAVLITALMTLTGSLIPALRALRVDPAAALRSE
ncbi:MAG: ABC transporter permease [Acidobacteriota bacterium]|nr:ABC transporter permease [Acidobacteriota bacterium]